MNEKSLKPCPFCGSEDLSVKSRKGRVGTIHKVKFYRGWVVCNKCGATGSEAKSPNLVKPFWNRRK